MGDEGIVIGGLDDTRRALECAGRIAVFAQTRGRCFAAQFHRLARKAFTALLRGRAFVPFNLQRLPRFFGLPPAIGHDGDTGHQAGQIRAALHHKGATHARHLADGVHVGFDNFAAKHRAFLEHGIEHAGDYSIDAEQWLALDQLRAIDARDRMTDDLVVFRVLQLDAIQVRHRQLRRRAASAP